MKTKFNPIRSVLNKACLLALCILSIQSVYAQNPYAHKNDSSEKSRNVFGTDDRKPAVGYTYRDYTNATAVAVSKSDFVGNYLTGKSLGDKLLSQYKSRGAQFVSSEIKFRNEPAFGFCSGFLIAPDILVTAGHCIDYDDYHKMEWIFDFTNDIKYKPGDRIYIPRSKRYTVKKIITRRLTSSDKRDYAVVQLDRPVDRKPFTFRTGNTISSGSKVTLLGAPSGIPLKIVENANVLSSNTNRSYFKTNLDAFGGNSGGPVFSSTGLIEGILVRGPTKGYFVDESCKCLKTSSYSEFYADYIQGVEVQKINDMPWEVLTQSLYSNIQYAIQKKNGTELKRWLVYNWIFEEPTIKEEIPIEILAMRSNDMKIFKQVMDAGGRMDAVDRNKKSLIQLAIQDNNSEAVKYLVREGYDLNKKDDKDETAVFWAIDSYKPGILELLVEYGASVNIKNSSGSTPIHEVAKSGSITMAEILVKNGADLLAENANGWNAKKIAKKSKMKSVKKYLKKEMKRQKKSR